MKELYNSPAAIMLAFDKKDVIVCSPHDPQEKPEMAVQIIQVIQKMVGQDCSKT